MDPALGSFDQVSPLPSEFRCDEVAEQPDVTTSTRLACPFYKRHGRQGSAGDSCEGKGWERVYRIKEHCYRQHAYSPTCPRCNRTFNDTESLKEHVKSIISCEPQPCSQISEPARLTPEQHKKIKRRKKKGSMTEPQLWNEMYKDLFPDQIIIPSPYANVDRGEAGVNPYFQNAVRTQLCNEILHIFKSVASYNDVDEAKVAKRLPEAIDKVIRSFKRPRMSSLDSEANRHAPRPVFPRVTNVIMGELPTVQAFEGWQNISPSLTEGLADNDLSGSLVRRTGFQGRVNELAAHPHAGIVEVPSKETMCGTSGTVPMEDPLSFASNYDTLFDIDETGIMWPPQKEDHASI